MLYIYIPVLGNLSRTVRPGPRCAARHRLTQPVDI